MKKILILILVVILGFTYRRLNQPKVQGEQTVSVPDMVLFISQTCPHCQNVEDYIQQNHLSDKIKIDFKEVYQQPKNQKLLQETADKCPNLDTGQGIGVPFAYLPATNSCLSGDTPIIDRLSQMVK
jgi:glutaredoxin-related protein